jgi:hypothetical protein
MLLSQLLPSGVIPQWHGRCFTLLRLAEHGAPSSLQEEEIPMKNLISAAILATSFAAFAQAPAPAPAAAPAKTDAKAAKSAKPAKADKKAASDAKAAPAPAAAPAAK